MYLSQALALIKDKSSWTKLSEGVVSAVSPKTCKDVVDAFTKTIESRCKKYEGCRVIFDNFGWENSIKNIIRRRKSGVQTCKAGKNVHIMTQDTDVTVVLAL